jgi:hypothetical protein
VTQTKSHPYTVVDVYTTESLSGNSLAVFRRPRSSTPRPCKDRAGAQSDGNRVCASAEATGLRGYRNSG